MSSNTKKRTIRNTVIGGAIAMVAGAALIGPVSNSGADFTASSTGDAVFKTANLSVNTSDAHGNTATFKIRFLGMVPGGTELDTFTVKNTGSIDANVKIGSLFSNASSDAPAANLGQLKVSIQSPGAVTGLSGTGGSVVYHLPATAVTALPSSIDLGVLKAGTSRTYTVQASLDQAAGNDWQGRTVTSGVTVTLQQR